MKQLEIPQVEEIIAKIRLLISQPETPKGFLVKLILAQSTLSPEDRQVLYSEYLKYHFQQVRNME